MPLRFLIADDLGAHQRLMSNIVGFLGGEMRFAENGRVAMSLAQSEEFDVVLMDLQMPELGGAAAADRLMHQWREREQRPRIVAVTADNSPERRALCRAIGMDGFIAKPYEAPALRDALQQVVINGHCWTDGEPKRLLDMKRLLDAAPSMNLDSWAEDASARLTSLLVQSEAPGPNESAQELRTEARQFGFLALDRAIHERSSAGNLATWFRQAENDLRLCVAAAQEALCLSREQAMAAA
jgi:CheY-like chemotaxis protein